MTTGDAVNLDELRQLVEQKAGTVKMLEALLEKEEAELIELERQLEAVEDSGGSVGEHQHVSPASRSVLPSATTMARLK